MGTMLAWHQIEKTGLIITESSLNLLLAMALCSLTATLNR